MSTLSVSAGRPPQPGSARSSRSPALDVAITVYVLACMAYVPSAGRYLLSLSSIVPSFAVGCVAILAAGIAGLLVETSLKRLLDDFFVAAAVIAAVTTHLIITALFFPVEVGRLATAVLLLGLAIITASLLARYFVALPADRLARALRLFSGSFLFVAALSAAGLQPPSPLAQLKPMFPFTEPSHFALTFTPFLIDACARSRSIGRLLWLAVALAMAGLAQSLSLFVGTALAAIVCLNLRELTIASLLSLSAFVLIRSGIDLAYYTDRLDLTESGGNLSSLVYLQGWDLVQESLSRTSGFGIGFMQLGYLPTNVPTADLIYRLAGNDLNLRDGSFTAAKLISEFGVFGIALLIVVASIAARSVLRLRVLSIGDPEARIEIMARSFIVGSMIDVFVRGIGYFSGTALMALIGVFILRELQRNRAARAGRTI